MRFKKRTKRLNLRKNEPNINVFTKDFVQVSYFYLFHIISLVFKVIFIPVLLSASLFSLSYISVFYTLLVLFYLIILYVYMCTNYISTTQNNYFKHGWTTLTNHPLAPSLSILSKSIRHRS